MLETNGFSTCLAGDSIQVDRMNVKYDRSTSKVTFDLAGTSTKEQNVTAKLTVTAYGRNVYTKEFDPCDPVIAALCPCTFIDSVICKNPWRAY